MRTQYALRFFLMILMCVMILLAGTSQTAMAEVMRITAIALLFGVTILDIVLPIRPNSIE